MIFFKRYLKKITLSEAEGLPQCVTNVTFMGMGEPFLNYDNVIKSIRILNDKNLIIRYKAFLNKEIKKMNLVYVMV